MCKRLGAPLLAVLVGFCTVQTASAAHCGAGGYDCCDQCGCDGQTSFSAIHRLLGRPGYKLVYDTVLEKRWHTCYQTVQETVNKQVCRTCYRNETKTCYKPCYETTYQTVQSVCCRPVREVCWKECEYTVCKPCYRTCYKE